MSIQDPSFHNADASTFELTEDGNLLPASTPIKIRRVYEDGSSIDWLHEESAERERLHLLRSQRGVRGILGPLMDDFRTWFVIGVTGIGIGLAGVS
jgi:chloride channel 3/4/5